MRIITDGKRFAVAKYQGKFTRLLDITKPGEWWSYRNPITDFICWTDLYTAECKIKSLQKKTLVFWDYPEKKEKQKQTLMETKDGDE